MKTAACIAAALTACMISAYADSGPSRRLFRFETRRDFAAMFCSGAKWDSSANGIVFREKNAPADEKGIPMGRIESGDLEPGFGFDEVVLSWNADTPPGSYLKIYVQVRSGEVWSRWFCYAIWNRDNIPMKRMSVRGQSDHIASLRADILYLRRPGDAVRVSASLCSAEGAVYPTLKSLTVHVMDTKAALPRARARKDVWGKDLDVPQLSQLSVPDGGRFCSATSTAMALSYWAQELNRPDLTCGVQQAVDGIYDIGWGGTGNWTFNTAFAGEYEGIRAIVTRFDSLSDIEQWIAAGVPVIVSLDYNKLRARDTTERSGHLMLVRGFTAGGEVILNDPATRLDLGRSGRVVYSREALEASWLKNPGSWGTVYLVYPEGWKIPRNRW
ncbi:MAG: C39 family peptidase [Armatimonadetes bacterium]|nr:C39 family peptidase [Armatimonadota bacterium]